MPPVRSVKAANLRRVTAQQPDSGDTTAIERGDVARSAVDFGGAAIKLRVAGLVRMGKRTKSELYKSDAVRVSSTQATPANAMRWMPRKSARSLKGLASLSPVRTKREYTIHVQRVARGTGTVNSWRGAWGYVLSDSMRGIALEE